jgi:hypothetical protein
MNNGLPRIEHDHVLTGVKAKPFGWPAASPDPGSGRGPTAASGSPLSKHPQFQVSTVSGDCHRLTSLTTIGSHVGVEPAARLAT